MSKIIEKINNLLLNMGEGEEKGLIKQLLKEHKRTTKQLDRIIKISDKHQNELKEKNERLKELSLKLSKYLSPQVYDSIFSGRQEVAIKSRRRKLTIFFSDIVNFTRTTEQLEPELLSMVLNKYLDEMSKIAINYGATIDKFIGDAILIFFGAPESFGETEDAYRCVSMAIEMREKVQEMGTEWSDVAIMEPFKVRMGITTGYVTVGNFGSEYKIDYTVIGSQVNLASRLQSAAGINNILISLETYSHVKDKILCEKKGNIYVKGIPYPIPTYQVINHFHKLRNKDEINISQKNISVYIDKERIIRSKESREEVIRKLESILNEIKEIDAT